MDMKDKIYKGMKTFMRGRDGIQSKEFTLGNLENSTSDENFYVQYSVPYGHKYPNIFTSSSTTLNHYMNAHKDKFQQFKFLFKDE